MSKFDKLNFFNESRKILHFFALRLTVFAGLMFLVRNARKAEERRKGKTRKDGRKGQTRKDGREGQTRKDGRKGQTGKVKFDITEYWYFHFRKTDADKCFLHFEKAAGKLK